MYKHILIPTDGSKVSEEAAAAAIELARALGARVTAVHVVPDSTASALDRWAHHDPKFETKLDQVFEKLGAVYLETIREVARGAGVRCDCRLLHGDSPYEAIIAASLDEGCDLVVMASHGRKGDSAGVLASETVKAATLGAVPVLIHKKARAAKASPPARARKK
jgi:nucleotide-binding universal stress UspA family protein